MVRQEEKRKDLLFSYGCHVWLLAKTKLLKKPGKPAGDCVPVLCVTRDSYCQGISLGKRRNCWRWHEALHVLHA